MINIITRTHSREREFNVLWGTVEAQLGNVEYNWIVGSDTDCQYYDAIKLQLPPYQYVNVPQGMYYAPWNTYLETLAKHCKDGYVMYIDDDDKFSYQDSLKVIADNCEEDTLLIWKVRITPAFIVPSHSFGKAITAGDISGIGYCFHTKYLPVQWGNLSYGDYRVAKQLEGKVKKIKWIDEVLTQTQNGARNGR